jgi:hypothetical protein
MFSFQSKCVPYFHHAFHIITMLEVSIIFIYFTPSNIINEAAESECSNSLYLCNISLLQYYSVTYTVPFCGLLQILCCNNFISINVYWNLVCSWFNKTSICKLSNVCTSNVLWHLDGFLETNLLWNMFPWTQVINKHFLGYGYAI